MFRNFKCNSAFLNNLTTIHFCSDTPIKDICIKKRADCLRSVENRMNLGLERQLNAVVGYIRFLLTNEQRKTDFCPEDDNQMVTAMSNVSFILLESSEDFTSSF